MTCEAALKSHTFHGAILLLEDTALLAVRYMQLRVSLTGIHVPLLRASHWWLVPTLCIFPEDL